MSVPGDGRESVVEQLLERKRAAQGAPPGEDRLAELERKVSELRRREPSAGGVEWLLLTFGQLVSGVGCLAAPIYALVALQEAATVPEHVRGGPPSGGWILVGALLGFLYSAAMFVVFSRVKRLRVD